MRTSSRAHTSALALLLLVAIPPLAVAAVLTEPGSPAGADAVAHALEGSMSIVTGGTWFDHPNSPGVASSARSDAAITSAFGAPLGPDFAILSTGDAGLAPAGPQSNDASFDHSTAAHGAHDVVRLRVDVAVPPGHNCLRVDLQFLSEEYPTWVGTDFNDAFVAELDASSWTVVASTIAAPNNFAFDGAGGPITVNSATMSAAAAAGTPYGGATERLTASTPVTPGAHSVFLSIFDAGDGTLDSAVFLDDLRTEAVASPTGCVPGTTHGDPLCGLFPELAQCCPDGGCHPANVTVEDTGEELYEWPFDTSACYTGAEHMVNYGFLEDPGGTFTMPWVQEYAPGGAPWPTTNGQLYIGATSAAWTGTQCLVFGGVDEAGTCYGEVRSAVPGGSGPPPVVGTLVPARHHTSAARDASTAYVFGGHSCTGPIADIVAVDLTTGATTTLPVSLPTPRYATSAVWAGDAFYIFGGHNGVTEGDEIVRFDPIAMTVAPVLGATLPTARSDTSAVFANGFAFIVGGKQGATALDDVLCFDPTTGAVVHVGSLPAPRHSTSATWDGHHVYVFGGHDGTRSHGDVYRFAP